jgi:peptide chain release factor 1
MSDNSLLDKLNHLVTRFEEIGTLITDPTVIGDMKRFVKLNKEYRELEAIVAARNEYKLALDSIEEAKKILESESDSDLRQLANEELALNTRKLPELEEQIKLLLIPADPEDDKNVIMEIRGGTGGDEASIFAGDLYKMYTRYCESKGWKTEVSSYTEGTAGGFKEIIFTVTGEKVYGTLKYESGTARSGNRDTGSRTHIGRYRCRTSRGGRVRGGAQPCRYRLPYGTFQWRWRAERKQGRDKGSAYPQTHRHRGGLPAGTFATG